MSAGAHVRWSIGRLVAPSFFARQLRDERMPEFIEIRLLGRVQIERNRVLVRGFESRKALALICYLAVQDRAVSRGELAALFWGDKSEAQSRANLSRVLHNNFELLPECLQIERDTVRLVRSSACWVDVAEFIELAAQDQVVALIAAADLFRGDLMPDISLHNCPEFETWLLTQQELWRQRVAKVLQQLIDIHRDRGEYEHGLSFASRLVTLDPWREEAHRQMMLMLALSGQRITALLQYETCCRILATELGVLPGEETTTLYKRIQDGAVGRVTATALPVSSLDQARLRSSPVPHTASEDTAAVMQILKRLDDTTCHLLTLLGKNDESTAQLACQIAQGRRRAFRDGVYTVALSPYNSNGAFLATLVNTIELKLDAYQDSRTQLLNHLRDRELLLVLTDFDPAFGQAVLLEDILKRAPHVKILVTARKPLNLAMEWIYDV